MSTTRQFIEPMRDVRLPGVPSTLLTQLVPALVVCILSLLSASTELSVSQSSCMEARYGHSQNLSCLERLHRKILHTLQGLPTRCKSSALTTLLGLQSVEQMINHRMLSFVISVANLGDETLQGRFSSLELIAAQLKA